MFMWTRARLGACAVATLLSGCVAQQNNLNTVEMADGISYIRNVQVLRNIAVAIDDPNFVPSQILLGNGQSTIDTGLTPSFKLPIFAKVAKEFDIGATDTWHANWVFASVTNSDDLRRLRNLYALLASNDDEYARNMQYIESHYTSQNPRPCLEVLKEDPKTWVERNPTIGSNPGGAPPWQWALCTMKEGDSIGCKLYQAGYGETPSVGTRRYPFRRWLFWRKPGGEWEPSTSESGRGKELESLGTYGSYELGVTSRACFDDFVILVQGQIPKTEAKSQENGGQGALVTPP